MHGCVEMIHIDNNDDQFVATWVNDRGSIETRTIRVQLGHDGGFCLYLLVN